MLNFLYLLTRHIPNAGEIQNENIRFLPVVVQFSCVYKEKWIEAELEVLCYQQSLDIQYPQRKNQVY